MTADGTAPTRSITTCLLALAVMLVAHQPAAAQYFGRNQVQYETFDFQVLKTDHFDVYYYPEEEAAARDAARMAERWYTRLSNILDYRFEERQPLILYASTPAFQQTLTIGGAPGEGTGGVTEAFKQRIVLPLAASYQETDHVVGHELVHAFQYDISGLGRAGGGIEQAARRFNVPLWFIEGMAEYLSLGPVDANTAMWLRDAALNGNLPSIEQLTYDPRYFPYRWGQAFWAYVAGRWGDAVIGQILKQAGQGVPFEVAFERLLNVPLDEIGEDWQTAIRRTYLPMVADRREAREIARPLITQERGGGTYNVSPSLSPDGERVAFLSSRNNFDVSLYIADARTGDVERTLVKGTARNAHYASLNFISSAGTWSADGERFAFSAQRAGRDVLVVVRTRNGDREREYAAEGVDEITNPNWSPDGNTIVFSGKRNGLIDLYELDLQSGRVQALTNTPYTALQPSYSPDGSTIAFVTDEGEGTDLRQLRYGGYQLALFDKLTNQVRLLPNMSVPDARSRVAAAGVKNIDPVWTSDGTGLFYVSNRTGIPNIFRIDVATGEVSQLTDVFSGVSGITDLSPVITASRNGDRLLFTAYEDNGYNIYSLDRTELAGKPLVAPPGDTTTVIAAAPAAGAAVLPPVPRDENVAFNRVALYLEDYGTGLPSPQIAAAWETTNYNPRLSLDYLGQPQVGYGTGGAFARGGLYGGINGIFSDQLGYHTVYGALQVQGQIDEIGFSTLYLNRKNRWNWGVSAQRIPYIFVGLRQGIDASEPDLVRRQLVRSRLFDSSLQGLAQYPFSRVQRFEFSAGVRRLAQSRQIFEDLFDRQTLAFAGRREFDEDGGSFNMAEASAALVYDNALVGFTAPIAGQRYRFDVSPIVGEIQFVTATADYRRYQLIGPATIAVRGLHYGRYGRDSEGIFSDLYLAYPTLIRGYQGMFNRCRSDGVDCDIINQTTGSRLGIANAELRFPLIRRVTLGGGIAFPIDGIAFYDAGIAWTSGANPTFALGSDNPDVERGFLTSVGVGGRVNLFGYAVLEIDYVNPLQAQQGWHWAFAIQPGF